MKAHEYVGPTIAFILVAAAAVLSSVILGEVDLQKLPKVALILAALVLGTIGLVVATFWYAHRIAYRDGQGLVGEFAQVQVQVARVKAELASLLREANPPQGGSRFLCLGETEALERLCSEAWVVTRDFFWDLDHHWYRDEIVKPNINERNVSYTYFHPNTPDMKGKAGTLHAMMKNTKLMHFVPLDGRYFALMEHELVIYDPNGPKPQAIMVDIDHSRAGDPVNSIDLFLNERNSVPRLVKQLRDLRDGR